MIAGTSRALDHGIKDAWYTSAERRTHSITEGIALTEENPDIEAMSDGDRTRDSVPSALEYVE